MAINWQMGIAPDIIGNALNSFEEGRKLRRENNARNALGKLLTNPNDTAAFSALGENAPEVALQFQTQQAQLAQKQREQQNQHVEQLSRLLNHARDEATYQQSLAAAKQLGIDVSSAPPNYDPNYVNQQRAVLAAFQKDGGAELTAAAKNVQALGYDINTPEGRAVLANMLNAEYAKPYTDASGATRLHTPNIIAPAGAGAPAGVQEGATATNPQTGEKIQFKGGQWVPMGGGSGNAVGGFRP